MILQQKNSLSKELYVKEMFRYYLASLIQAVVTYVTQQKYGIRWKSTFVWQKSLLLFKSESRKKTFYVFVGRNFLLYFMIEIIIYAAICCITM